MNVLLPSMAWWFLLIPPLVILYFLKLKRPRQTVSSLVLWAQVMADERVNSPFQRFRRHILLWLQLLLLILLILAAMQPFFAGNAASAGRVPILVDVSASMGATDRPGGQTRLQAVQDILYKQVSEMRGGQEFALVAFADRAWRLCDFTDNPRLLKEAIGKLQVLDVAGKADEALRLAQAMAQVNDIDRVWMLSDGNVPATVDADLASELDYQIVPAGGANLGITSLRARMLDSRWEVLAVVSAGHAAGSGVVEIRQGADVLTEETVSCAPGESQRVLLTLPTVVDGRLDVALTVDGADSLSSDNMAWLDLPTARPIRVAIGGRLPRWQRALQTLEDIELVEPSAVPDLLISEDEAHLSLPATVRMFVGIIDGDVAACVDRVQELDAVVDWKRLDPILRHVELGELGLLDQPRWRDDLGVADLEARGYRTLLFGQRGPLLVQAERERSLDYSLLVHTNRSTLPYRVGFPIFVANLVNRAKHRAGLAEVAARQTGTISLDGLSPGEWTCQDPQDQRTTVVVNQDGRLAGLSAPHVGLYTLQGDAGERSVSASLVSTRETMMPVTDSLRFREMAITASAAASSGERPLWHYLVMAGLAVLFAEWWFVQRRPGGWN